MNSPQKYKMFTYYRSLCFQIVSLRWKWNIYSKVTKMLGLIRLILDRFHILLLSDLFPLAEAVFLELPGLEWDLSVCVSVCSDGHWLPGVPVLCHSETPAEKHYGAHANSRPHHSSQGKVLLLQVPRLLPAYVNHYWKVFKLMILFHLLSLMCIYLSKNVAMPPQRMYYCLKKSIRIIKQI